MCIGRLWGSGGVTIDVSDDASLDVEEAPCHAEGEMY